MPIQPLWFQRLESIMLTLREIEAAYLDRLAVQKLFSVKERRARQIMAGLPGLQVGNAFAISRTALLRSLEEKAAGDAFQWELSRRSHVIEELDRARLQIAARQVHLAVAPDVRERELATLPAGVHLEPKVLTIRFDTAEDLASKLFELSQAMANDWPSFQQVTERL